MEPAIRSDLIAETGVGIHDFTHDNIRETLYSELSPIRRQRLHGLIGHAIEQGDSTDQGRFSALAFHFSNSGDRARGAAYATSAMETALRSFAVDEAVELAEPQLELTPFNHQNRGHLLESWLVPAC